MAESIIYSSGYVTQDSAVLAEAASIKINKNPDLKVVGTLAKGFAGINLGIAQCMVTIETAVPSADFEMNPDEKMRIGKQVELGVYIAGRKTVGKFFISEADYQVGVGVQTSLTISYIGPLKVFE